MVIPNDGAQLTAQRTKEQNGISKDETKGLEATDRREMKVTMIDKSTAGSRQQGEEINTEGPKTASS